MKRHDAFKDRLSRDFKLMLVLLVGTLTVLVVTPFMIYRFVVGPISVAIADLLIVVIAGVSVAWALRTGIATGAGVLLSVQLSAGALFVSWILGIDGALWVYPVVFFLSYLVPQWAAIALLSLILAPLGIREILTPGGSFSSVAQAAGFFFSVSTTAVFSFVFAHHSRRHQDQLVRWATRDPLTGLYNRRSLEEELDRAVAARGRHNTGFGLIILDLDNFKLINDKWGHAAGDQVLVSLAEVIRSSTRREDRAFRYGGDEFILLLGNIDMAGLRSITENLQQNITRDLKYGDQAVYASLGAALLQENEDPEGWNRRADRSLYEAKECGRNCFVIADEEDRLPSPLPK